MFPLPFLLIFTLAISTPCPLPPFPNTLLISFPALTSSQLSQLNSIIPVCPLHPLHPDLPLLLILPSSHLSGLLSSSLPSPEIISTNFSYTLSLSPPQKPFTPLHSRSFSRSLQDSFYRQYRDFQSLRKKWRLISTLSPHVSFSSVAKSLQNRTISLLVIGSTSEQAPRRIFINALQHAREWIATHAVTYLAETLALATLDPNDPLHPLLNRTQVLIMPMINPDGYVYSSETYRLARKNRRKAGCNNSLFDGVDLNRNWPVDWGGSESTSDDPCAPIYYGAGALSEVETQALRDVIERTDGIYMHFDVHSYGQLLLEPLGYTDARYAREKESSFWARRMAEAVINSGGEEYTYGNAGKLLYFVSGSMMDWVAEKGILSYTPELRPSLLSSMQSGFELEEEQIIATGKDVVEMIRVALQYEPGIDIADEVSGLRLSPLSIALIVIGVVVFSILLVLLLVIWRRRQTKVQGI